MDRRSGWHVGRYLAVVVFFTAHSWAQGGGNSTASSTQLFHPAGPLPTYEVATIKKPAPNAANGMHFPPGMGPGGAQSVKNYILSAYGSSLISPWQVVGGPEWMSSELYVMQGKPSDAQREALAKLSFDDRLAETRKMQQSLLADRFKLKSHIETREMPVFELVSAKNGLKIKAVPPPPPVDLGPAVNGAPPPPPAVKGIQPGMLMLRSDKGTTTFNARATTMRQVASFFRQTGEVGGRPIIDKTGFTANFDVTDLQFAGTAGFGSAGPPTEDSSAPSLFTAIEETLGLKLVASKGPVEILVVDSIERPTEN